MAPCQPTQSTSPGRWTHLPSGTHHSRLVFPKGLSHRGWPTLPCSAGGFWTHPPRSCSLHTGLNSTPRAPDRASKPVFLLIVPSTRCSQRQRRVSVQAREPGSDTGPTTTAAQDLQQQQHGRYNSRNTGPTTAATWDLQRQQSPPGKKPPAAACNEGLKDLASYFLCYTPTQSNVHLLYIRTLRLDLTSIAFKCFIYFPKNRQFCWRGTQGEILTSLKALGVWH